MDSITTMTTETLGAFAMPAGPPNRVRTMAVQIGVQGTSVSVPTCGLKVPAYAGFVPVTGTDRITDAVAVLTKTTDVAHPRLEGPPV